MVSVISWIEFGEHSNALTFGHTHLGGPFYGSSPNHFSENLRQLRCFAINHQFVTTCPRRHDETARAKEINAIREKAAPSDGSGCRK